MLKFETWQLSLMNKLQQLEIFRDKILEVITISDILNREGVKTRGRRSRCLIHGGRNDTTFGFDKITYHCFKCGAKGQVVDLVMQINNITFEEALQKINYDFGLAFDFDEPIDSLTVNKWEEEKRKREAEKQRRLEEEKRLLDLIKFRQLIYEQGKDCSNFDEVLDYHHEVIKHLGVRKYERSDFE
jgi:DNA primase